MKLVVGNFKMNLLQNDIEKYIETFRGVETKNVVFCPPSIYLTKFINNNYNVGSQDISFMESGAYTGDVSVKQLEELGIKYTLIGHSERRKYYNDSNYVNQKILLALTNQVIPILCVGENYDDRQSSFANQVIKMEIDDAFKNIDIKMINKVIIAYEPVWAIGTNVIPTKKEIRETIDYIKNYIKEKYCFDIKVLYGGSVNATNINLLETIDNIDGYLVGGCSVNANSFIDLIRNIGE